MSYTYANNVRAALGAAVGVGDVTLTIAAAVAPFNPPAAASVSVPARLTIVDNLYAPTKIEIVTYTGRTGTGPYTLTGVTRAQESTTAQAFTTGYVYQSATAADFSAFSALTDLTPIGVLGTGTDTGLDSQGSLVISHSTLSSASRFKRVGAVYEYAAGSSLTDSTTDFDFADIANYIRDTESPSATITPSAVSNTYQDFVFDSTASAAYVNLGRTGVTNYQHAHQWFKGPCAATGFTLILGANSGTPTGNINWRLVKVPMANKTAHWDKCQTLTSGAFSPTPSATNTINFSSTIYMDDSWYAIVLHPDTQDGDGDFFGISGANTTTANARGYALANCAAAAIEYSRASTIDPASQQLAMTLVAGKINAGVTLTISGDYWYPSDIGKAVRGNSGHFLITGLTDLCTGGTALSSAGTAANAFDNNIIGTTCAAGANGYVGYDFGSSKTIRGVAVMFADSVYDFAHDLIIEVSDDNFSASTTVVNPGERIYSNRNWYYFDITSPTAGRYIRIRETGGATMTVSEMECFDGTTALAHLHLSAFTNTDPITSGNWTLESPAWEDGWVSSEVSSGMIAPVSTSNFASIDSISSALTYASVQRVGHTRYTTAAQGLNLVVGAQYGRKICHLGSDKYAIIYGSNSNADAYAVIASIDSAGAVTFGAPSAFILSGTYTHNTAEVVALSSSLFVIAHANKLYACTVSGTTITVGAALSNTASTDTTRNNVLVPIDSTRFLAVGMLVTTGYVAVVVGSISGTTITLGAKLDLNAADTSYITAVKFDTDKTIVAYQQLATSTTLRAKVVTATGTVATAGAEATVAVTGQAVMGGGFAVSPTTNLAVICTYSTIFVQAVAASVSGTAITFGTVLDVRQVGYGYGLGILPHSANRVLIGDKDLLVPVSISGTTLSVSAPAVQPTGWNSYITCTPIGATFAASMNAVEASSVCVSIDVWKLTAQGKLLTGAALSVSFDGTTYKVWNGSAARNIASSLNSVHGGTNGVWYYRDSASVWTAASSSTALQALKQAQAYGANCMSMDEMILMSAANWVTLGFVEPTATTYFAFTWSPDQSTRYLTPFDMTQLTIGYTSRATWNQATQNYAINMGAEDKATVTKITASAASVKAVILGPTS